MIRNNRTTEAFKKLGFNLVEESDLIIVLSNELTDEEKVELLEDFKRRLKEDKVLEEYYVLVKKEDKK